MCLVAGIGCATPGSPVPKGEAISVDWTSPLYRGHPLVGRIWQVRTGTFVPLSALESVLAQADFVLLGETHDNPDHHLLQARLVLAIGSTGRQPALAFEMLQTNQQALVNSALVGSPPTPDAVADAVDWRHSSWPDFSLYRPVFAAGIRDGLPVLAADLPRETVHRFFSEGSLALPEPVRRLLARQGPLTPAAEGALRAEMARVHCGQLPQSMLGKLVSLQEARDAALAQSLLAADEALAPKGYEQGAVLIAGSGHARNDRGVPSFLSREAPQRTAVAVAFVEVSPEATDPEAYASEFDAASLPFDYVVFTPAAERKDPCLELKKKLHPPPPGPPPAEHAVAHGAFSP